MPLPHSAIRAGRDRVSEVLAPLLGGDAALERANNIAQALVLGDRDAATIATDMLRNSGLRDTSTVAERIGRAWHEGIVRRPRGIDPIA